MGGTPLFLVQKTRVLGCYNYVKKVGYMREKGGARRTHILMLFFLL